MNFQVVDVFDQQGNYVDNFYIFLPGNVDLNALYSSGTQIAATNFYIRETGNDGNYMVTQYEIPLLD